MRFIIYIFIISFSLQGFSQGDSCVLYKRSIIIQPHFGFIIPHRSEMEHLITGHSRGVNIQWIKQTNGDKPWHHRFNFPEEGFDLFYNYTGNSKQLGHQMALSYLLRLPLQKKSVVLNKQRLGLGVGLGYNTKTWELKENSQAQVLGSHLNAALTLEYLLEILQSKHADLHLGIRLTHFSNGAFQLPNLGTNNFSITALFQLKQRALVVIPKREVLSFSKQTHWYVFFLGGLKEISQPLGRKYTSLCFSSLLERTFSDKSNFGLGVDVFFSSAVRALRTRQDQKNVSWSESAQLGAVLSYGLNFDRVTLHIQQGFYLMNVWQADGRFYQRVNLRYRATDKWFLQAGLKTHFAKADYAEFGIGRLIK